MIMINVDLLLIIAGEKIISSKVWPYFITGNCNPQSPHFVAMHGKAILSFLGISQGNECQPCWNYCFQFSETVDVVKGRPCPKENLFHAFPDLHILYSCHCNMCRSVYCILVFCFWHESPKIPNVIRATNVIIHKALTALTSQIWSLCHAVPIRSMQAEERPTRESWGPVLVLGDSGRSLHAYNLISDR